MKNLISRRLSTLIRDPGASLMFVFNNLQQETEMRWDTFWCKILAYMWGVQLESSCKFSGRTHFRKYPGSTISIGKNCRFRSSFQSNMVGLNHPCGISTHHKHAEIFLGEHCGFSGTIIGAAKSIVLGERVLCGANVTITDFDWHGLNPTQRNQGGIERAQPIRIGDNVWLGLNTLVLKGVEIGSNTVVGANSVVSSSLPENVLAVGIPARVIRSLSQY
jgi:acetyltransferase-like isoleucine patch superfamily enzyme